MDLFGQNITEIKDSRISDALSSTFKDNLSLPIHRWFKYTAGFSAKWVKAILNSYGAERPIVVLDPFVGSGTVILEAQFNGLDSVGFESHPFISRIAEAKLLWQLNTTSFINYSLNLLQIAKKLPKVEMHSSQLILKCYPDSVLEKLYSIRRALDESENSNYKELAWLALVSILRECSPVGTAQWQYVLPNRSKAKVAEPYLSFERKIYLMASDMKLMQESCLKGNKAAKADLRKIDARYLTDLEPHSINIVVTSPPYINNYDYADATRLEMSFMGEIKTWGDLQNIVRRNLVRSCTQHVSDIVNDLEVMLSDDILSPIAAEIRGKCALLAEEKLNHGGKKNYDIMIAAYFHDMARIWNNLRRYCAYDSKLCYVIGDSAPYGVHIPVEKWLGELALNAGFSSYKFEKTRDRNIKWKNRKHNVPLQEGNLWIDG